MLPCGYVGSLPTLPRSMGSSNMIITYHSCFIFIFIVRTPSHDHHLSFLYHFLFQVKRIEIEKKTLCMLIMPP